MSPFSRPVQFYIVAVILGGGAALYVSLPKNAGNADLVLLSTLAAASILAGVYQLPLAQRHEMINLTGGTLLMAAFLAGPGIACALAAVSAVISGLVCRRPIWNIVFAAGASVVSIGVAAGLYGALALPEMLPLDNWENAVALFFSSASFWLILSAMVSVVVAARNDESFSRTFRSNWRDAYLQYTLLTLLAVLGAAAWRQGTLYALLLVVPAVAVYQLLSVNRMKQEQVIRAIEIIAEVLDRRNPFTFQHSLRVASHTVKIARRLSLSDQDTGDLRRAALIHDIGKLGVDDPVEEVPLFAESMTDYQFYSLKQHAQLGAMIAREIPVFEGSEEAIRYHHDWYDGSHTSMRLAEGEIPLGARIVAVADTYDQLCMANGDATLVYDPIAVEQLKSFGGNRLDPDLLALFLGVLQAEHVAQPSPAPRVARPAMGT